MLNELVVLVVDDEPKVAEVLKTIIEKKVNYQERIIVHTAASVQEAVKQVQAFLPDIVFLDIHMPEEDGFELFNYVDKNTFEVVFTTAYDQYAIEAINKYDCLKYLLKPIGIQDVQNVFDKYKELEGYQYFYKVIKNNQKRYMVRVDDIVYCKAADNYCEIYLKDQKYLISKTLKNVEDKIKHKNFIRVNRSYLVNVDYIDYIDKETNIIHFKEIITVNNEETDNVITVAASVMKDLNNLNL
ncbi:MAG: LytTR family DNA-binding domain-containing protein [Myroides sp.]|jgi:two-component system LytT family response regulator|uniref:LytR/AlgR family response regulator transcription factor n=1 Tax=Myroides TaxID=76831 RepID=UPI00074201AE|nr:LytTR family DNA-binding domain-containing protein [Myroides marinus]MDR0194173.1 LytTR family DNA-binding domain-containing protein [Myroides sp.]KUF39039.1 LytTR family transcriptional regulator [Myroides marinus]MDM1391569.1 response regulator transcription factor [Myroides marinus]MDM1533010.1 response regulator transcription factor [Myroides marinus]MDM1540013.1 response regulator transcription factor [Myroides marinus]